MLKYSLNKRRLIDAFCNKCDRMASLFSYKLFLLHIIYGYTKCTLMFGYFNPNCVEVGTCPEMLQKSVCQRFVPVHLQRQAAVSLSPPPLKCPRTSSGE